MTLGGYVIEFRVFQMNRRTTPRRFTKDVAYHLLEQSSNISQIVAIPPENVDGLTDEDDIDDENTEQTVQIQGDLPGTFEIIETVDDSEEESDNNVDHHATNKHGAKWTKENPKYNKVKLEEFDSQFHEQNVEMILTANDEVDVFEKFLTDEILDHIVAQSGLYAKQKNEHSFSLTKRELKSFIGIILLSGYHHLPSERHYWSQAQDLGVPLVQKSMTRNRFLKIKQMLHFNDNENIGDKPARDFKIKPLIDKLNENFKRFGIFERNLSVDEQIVSYYGHHALKQFIANKPLRFGFKNWILAADNGYCFHISLYTGKKLPADRTAGNERIGLGESVVFDMLEYIDDESRPQYILHIDNFFTSYSLLCKTAKIGLPTIGTLRASRTASCPLVADKDLKNRGDMDHCFDKANEITILKWRDNKCVIVGTNFASADQTSVCKRWCKSSKAEPSASKIDVPIPDAVKLYNKGMGGVDKLDWYVNLYRSRIRSKKWYWCLVTAAIDICIVNAYLIHRKITREDNGLLNFRRTIAFVYLKQNTRDLKRPFLAPSGPNKPKIHDALRFDGDGHYLETRKKQQRCQMMHCSSKPLTFCAKCEITLCKGCFKPFHEK